MKVMGLEIIARLVRLRRVREARRGDPAGLFRRPAKPGLLAMTDFEGTP
jgi:hypothetical protein